jgi:hypothetical protein
MRYYEINIFDGDTLIQQYSSLKNGVYNPGALMVEFDIMRFGESTPAGETHLTVWGIGPKDMQQARQNLYGKRIQIFAGMSKGCRWRAYGIKSLPLREPFFRCSATGRAQSYGWTSSLLLVRLTPRPAGKWFLFR